MSCISSVVIVSGGDSQDDIPFFDVLEDYCNFCISYEAHTGFRCNLPSVGYAGTYAFANVMLTPPAAVDAPPQPPPLQEAAPLGWEQRLPAITVPPPVRPPPEPPPFQPIRP